MRQTAGTSRYVLVVEDDATLRELCCSALRAAGFSVVAVQDGVEALQYVQNGAPGALVLDLDLLGARARAVKNEIAAIPAAARIPVIVLSSSDASTLNRYEFTSILRKPISTDELIGEVRRCLRRC